MAAAKHLSLEIELENEPISGLLRDEHGASLAFAGWLEFASALERLLRPSWKAQETTWPDGNSHEREG